MDIGLKTRETKTLASKRTKTQEIFPNNSKLTYDSGGLTWFHAHHGLSIYGRISLFHEGDEALQEIRFLFGVSQGQSGCHFLLHSVFEGGRCSGGEGVIGGV